MIVVQGALPPMSMVLQGAIMAVVMLIIGASLFKHNSKSFILYI